MSDSNQVYTNGISHCAEYMEYRKAHPDTCKNNVRCEQLFSRLSDYEKKVNTAFTLFTTEQMSEFYKTNLIQSTPMQAMLKIKFLQSYLMWLRENEYIDDKSYVLHPFFRMTGLSKDLNDISKYGTINKMTEDNAVDLDYVRSTMFFSEEEFTDYCKTIFQGDNLEMELAIYCLAWCGVPIQEIGNIRKDWVNEKERTVSYKDDKNTGAMIDVKISNDFCLSSIIKARDSVGFSIERQNGRIYRATYKQDDYEYLIRQVKTNNKVEEENEEGYSRLRGIMSHLMTKIRNECKRLPDYNPFKNKRVSLRNVYSSGLFYRYSFIEDQVSNPFSYFGNSRYYNYIVWKKARPEA